MPHTREENQQVMEEHRAHDSESARARRIAARIAKRTFIESQDNDTPTGEPTEEMRMDTPTPPPAPVDPEAPPRAKPKARAKPTAKPNAASMFRGTAAPLVHQELRLYHRGGAAMYDYLEDFQRLLNTPAFFRTDHDGVVLPNPIRYVEFAFRYAIMMRWLRDQYRLYHVRFFVIDSMYQRMDFEETLVTTYRYFGRRNLYNWDDLRNRMVIPRDGPWPTYDTEHVGQLDRFMSNVGVRVDLEYLTEVLSSPNGTWGFIDNNVHLSEIPTHDLWIATQRNPMHDYFLNMLLEWRRNAAMLTSTQLMSRDFMHSIPHQSLYWQLPTPTLTSHRNGLFITNPPSEVMARYASFLWDVVLRASPTADRYTGAPPLSITMDSAGRVTSDPLSNMYRTPENEPIATFDAWGGHELGMPRVYDAPPVAPPTASTPGAAIPTDEEMRGPTGPTGEPEAGGGPFSNEERVEISTDREDDASQLVDVTQYGIHGWTPLVHRIRNACFWRSVMVFRHGTRRTGIREADLEGFVEGYWNWVVNMPLEHREELVNVQPITLDMMTAEFARLRAEFYQRDRNDRMNWMANDFHVETMARYLGRRIVIQNVNHRRAWVPHFQFYGDRNHPANIYIQHDYHIHFEALIPNGPRTTAEITRVLEGVIDPRVTNPFRIVGERVPELEGVAGELDLHPHHIEAFRAQGIVYVEPNREPEGGGEPDGGGPDDDDRGRDGLDDDGGGGGPESERTEPSRDRDTLMRVADVEFEMPDITAPMLQNNLGAADPNPIAMTPELIDHLTAYFSNPHLEKAWKAGRPAASAIVGPRGNQYRLRELHKRYPLLINEFHRNWRQYRKRLDTAQRRDPQFQAEAREVAMEILRVYDADQERLRNRMPTRVNPHPEEIEIAFQNPDDITTGKLEVRHNRNTPRYQPPPPRAVVDVTDHSTDRPGSSLPSTPRGGGPGGGGSEPPPPPPRPPGVDMGTSPDESDLFNPPPAMDEDNPPPHPAPLAIAPDPIVQRYNELLQQYNQQTQELTEARETLIKAQQDHGEALSSLSEAERVRRELIQANSLQETQRSYDAHRRELARLNEQLTQQEAALQEARTAVQDSGRVFEEQQAQIQRFQREREQLQAQWDHRDSQFNHRTRDLEAERQRMYEAGAALEVNLRQTRDTLHGILRDNETYLLQNEAQRRTYLAEQQELGFQAIRNQAAVVVPRPSRPPMGPTPGELEAREELGRKQIHHARDIQFMQDREAIRNSEQRIINTEKEEIDWHNRGIDLRVEEDLERTRIERDYTDGLLTGIQIHTRPTSMPPSSQPTPSTPTPPSPSLRRIPSVVSVRSTDSSLPPPSEHPVKEEEHPDIAGVGQRVDDDAMSSTTRIETASEHTDSDSTEMSDVGSVHSVAGLRGLPLGPPGTPESSQASTPREALDPSPSEMSMLGGLYARIFPDPPSPVFLTPPGTPRAVPVPTNPFFASASTMTMAPPPPRVPPMGPPRKGANGFDVAPDILDPRRARHKLFGDFRNALIGTVRPDPRMPRQAGTVVPRRFHS